MQDQIIDKRVRLWVIDADRVAREVGLGSRANTVLQTCFFAVSGVLPRAKAVDKIKASIEKTYKKKGKEIVRRNFEAVDRTLAALDEVEVPREAAGSRKMLPIVAAGAPPFVQNVVTAILEGRGDALPVSAFPVDGTFPSATARWEKRGISTIVPEWDAGLCIQCGNCSFVCPHAVIRARVYPTSAVGGAPDGFQSAAIDARGFPDTRYGGGCPI